MCVPSIFIRDDGGGFVVRRGGIDFDVFPHKEGFGAQAVLKNYSVAGTGKTIMEAVEGALSQCDGNIQ